MKKTIPLALKKVLDEMSKEQNDLFEIKFE
jgi:hypothetical protein